MALVRKFQEAGKIDSDKKVLVYENVGNYDADKLASVLTLNLDDQAKSLDLSGKDRQAFMQYGAEMILAIKDGNVTKNADGSFSIKGNYGLNNKYSSSEVAEKFANGEVGYGAKKYEGTYQKSHGIFTTDETRDFRHRNHILGLVGQWVNNNLKSLDIIEEKTEEPKELKKFSFNDTFVKANLAGNANLLNDWKTLINTQEGRNQALIKAIDNLTPEDYEAWALENPNLGSAADLLKLISPLRLALTDGDVKKAQELAFNLGISINDYIIPDLLTSNNPLVDPYLALARQQLTTGDNALGNPSEELIAQYAEYLRLEGKTLIEKSLLDKFNKVIDNAWLVEQQRLRDELQGNEVFFDSQSTDNAINPAKKKEVVVAEVGSMQEEMERMKSYIDDLGPDMDPKLQEGFGLNLDILGDTYNALVSGKAKYPEGFKDAWFQEITDGDYKGKVIFKWLLTDKYSIIYDPENGKFYRIPNLLLPETELFKLLKDAFAALIRSNNENNQEVPSEKQGGILKYEIGGGIKDATLLDWGGKEVTQTKPEKVDFAKARETAGLGDEHYEPQNSNEPKKPLVVRKINGPEDMQSEDWWRIGSVITDLGALGASYTGAGAVGSAALGFASTVANGIADHYDENVTSKEAALSFITGTLADIASLLPFSRASLTSRKVVQWTQKLSPYVPWIISALNASQGLAYADEFKQSLDRLGSGEGFTSNDLVVLTNGLRFILGSFAGGRSANRVNRHADNMQTVGLKVLGTDGKWYPITEENLAKLKLAKDVIEANRLFKQATGATVELPTKQVKSTPPKGKKVKETTHTEVQINSRPYKEVPEVYYEEANGMLRRTTPAYMDRLMMNTGKVPSVSLWINDKQNKLTGLYNRLRGYKIKPIKDIPEGAEIISDSKFKYNNEVWAKGNDGMYYIETPTILDHAPNVKLPDTKKAAAKRLGGSFEFASELALKLANGGFVPKMEGGGWFEVTDNANKKHYFKDKKAADWFREKNNITADSKEVDFNAYDHGWYLGDLYDEWAKANYTKGKTGIPYNAALRDAAIKLETEDPEYKEFTKWVIDSLKEGKGNAYNTVIDYLHRMANLTDGQNYFKDDGKTLIDNYDLILLNYYYDHARGYHHHKGTHRGNETLYYLNGELVDQDAVKDLTMDHEYGQESEDKTITHKFYVTDKQGDTLNGGDQLIPATDETDPNAPLEYKDRLNWGNISEAGRVLWLNARNAKAAEQSMNWDPALVGYIHRNEMLEGDYESLKNAEEGQAALNSKAGLTFSTDANTQLAAQLLATDQGNQLSLKAAQADSNKFYDSRHKILNLLNEDMLYNRKAADTNMTAIADKEKSDANIKANLTLENATNLSNMWAGISKQIMDGYDRRKQQLLHYEMKRAANRQAVAASEYNARKAALDTTDKKKYAEDLANLGKEYMDALDRSNKQELERTRRLLGPDVLHIASLIRKGKKLTADLRYILSGSQDFNRRKLSDAKEFYKNIRENQRKRKS